MEYVELLVHARARVGGMDLEVFPEVHRARLGMEYVELLVQRHTHR